MIQFAIVFLKTHDKDLKYNFNYSIHLALIQLEQFKKKKLYVLNKWDTQGKYKTISTTIFTCVSILVHFNAFCYINMKSCTTAVHQNLA